MIMIFHFTARRKRKNKKAASKQGENNSPAPPAENPEDSGIVSSSGKNSQGAATSTGTFTVQAIVLYFWVKCSERSDTTRAVLWNQTARCIRDQVHISAEIQIVLTVVFY